MAFLSRFMKRLVSLRRTQVALLTLGTLAGMVAWAVFSHRSQPKAPDPARVQLWQKITPRLQQADQDGAQTGQRHLERLSDFFIEKRWYARDFAEDALGWGGKWAFVKGKVAGDDGKAHQEYLRAAFERHFFTGRDLQELLQSVITGYLTEVEGQENALLVAIRADLSEQDLPALQQLAALRSDEAFRNEYRKMLEQVIPTISRDMKITLGREAVVWVGSDIAAAVTVRIASAVAVRLGISGGILGTGAASGVATLGIGVVVGFLVDGAVDWIMQRIGYDPVGKIAGEVSATLSRIEQLLLDGDPEAHTVYRHMRRLQDQDPIPFVRSECRKAADRVETGGSLGLRYELNRLRELRCRLREAALKRLILEGGGAL